MKFQKHILQLLPGPERRSYAGSVVVEALDGRLPVQHEGRASLLPGRRRPIRDFFESATGLSQILLSRTPILKGWPNPRKRLSKL